MVGKDFSVLALPFPSLLREIDAGSEQDGEEWDSVSRWTVVAKDGSIAAREKVTVPPLSGTLSPVSVWTHVHTQARSFSLPTGKLHLLHAYPACSWQTSHTNYPPSLPLAM